MCQICTDFAEFDAAIDAHMAREFRKLLRPAETEALFGTQAE